MAHDHQLFLTSGFCHGGHQSVRSATLLLAGMLLTCLLGATQADAADLDQWGHWRGPLGTGTSPTATPPTEFGPSNNCAWKQPIPYVAVTCEDTVFTMTRLTGGEARLHGKRSIGVGGHINPCDIESDGVDGLLAAACERELEEELILPAGPHQLEPLGLLNDDTTEVGAVHVGVVYRLVLTPAQASELRIRETDSLAGEFLPYSELVSLAEQDDAPFESWSTLLLRSGVLASSKSPSMSLA